MPSSDGTSEGSGRCRPWIVDAGLPQRGDLILQRERNLYPLTISRLLGRRQELDFDEAAGLLTMEMLESAFAGRQPAPLIAAAWLAGRCQPEDPRDQERLTALVGDFLRSVPSGNPGVLARPAIEAAMSLALRGDPGAGRDALVALLETAPDESYLAAFYLAQLGDPSGYPAMLRALRHPNEHIRLMAARHLAAFKPFDGEVVSGVTVDVRSELLQRLRDHDAYVRIEMPYYLAEVDAEGLEDLLRPVARKDRNKQVRQAARDVLKRVADA
jgi:hypothetical protein